MLWASIEKTRRIRRQESGGDGGAGEKKERKTKAKNDLSERESSWEDARKTELNGDESL